MANDNDNPSGKRPPAIDEATMAPMRERIDELDRRIVDSLSERARIVTSIGEAKRASGYPVYAPHREKQVLERVLALNEGPLPDRTVEAIYRELMSGSFVLEMAMRVGYLGPPGSFSHVAATRHFGSSVDFEDLHTIDHVFEEVAAGRCRYGLVPYENSIGGGITDTLDAIQQHDVTIYAEALVEVRHAFLANDAAESITKILSKPQVFDQCRRWIREHFPDAELVPCVSSSQAARDAAETPGAAAIGSTLAGEIYGLHPLYEPIQDKANNITRFLIIGREAAQRTGDDKTSIMFVTAHKPGALVDMLAVFRDADVNLSHIDKRPSGRTNWEYTFFVDADVHRDDPGSMEVIQEASKHCLSLKVLGSYPRAQRIL